MSSSDHWEIISRIDAAWPQERGSIGEGPSGDQGSLEEIMTHVLEEARMVLPGIQALFGFQLVAVFNNRFGEVPRSGQLLHLIAMCAVTVSTALVIAPAAYYRQAEPNTVSQQLVTLSTRFLVLGMLMLTVGICLDIEIVAGKDTELAGGDPHQPDRLRTPPGALVCPSPAFR